MRKSLLTIGSVLAAVLFVSAGVADTGDEAPPEFYFTRLLYSTIRGPSQMPRGEIECADLAAGEGGTAFGGGWATDFPASDCKFMWGVDRLTNIRVYKKRPHVVAALDPELFKYPYLYIVEPSRMFLTSEEAAALREYLDRGGFLHVDDFWGREERDIVEEEMAKIFPDRPMKTLDLKHEVFRNFFEVDQIMQIPNVSNGCNGGRTWERPSETTPMVFGISDDRDRLMVVVTYNSDLGDAWEWMDRPCYPEMYSGQAYRMGINFIIYAMSH
jgi:hypothetical protein